MNKRTIYLLIGAGLVGALFLADQSYRNYVEAPSAEREKQLNKVEKAIDQANNLIAQKLSVENQLDAYEKMSLPFDTEVTRTAYQGWLLNQVKSVGLTNTSVDAAQPRTISIKRQKPKKNQPSRKVVLVRYGYSLRCRGSLQQVVSFLFRFYRSGHLHKIRSLTLNPSGGGAVIDVVFSIEALSMMRTERDTQLTSARVNRVQTDDENHYAEIARRNIFSRTGSLVLQKTYVSAITFGKSGKPQVWLKNDLKGSSQVLQNDDTLLLDSHKLEVLDIQSELALFLIDGQPITVGVGKPLMNPPQTSKTSDSTGGAVEPGSETTEKSVEPPPSKTPPG